jgi:hypothetical protein
MLDISPAESSTAPREGSQKRRANTVAGVSPSGSNLSVEGVTLWKLYPKTLMGSPESISHPRLQGR